jgi:hypothetical protein
MALVDNAWYVDYGNGSSTGYYAVTAWAALTTRSAGALCRQLAAPAVGSERVFVLVAGNVASGAAEPTWVITRGGKTTDATETWQEATGIAALNGDFSANTPLWSNASIKNTAITLGQVITNVAGTIVLICTTAGTAGNGAEPSWATYTTAGATTVDNGATWTNIGVVGNFTGWQAPHARLANAFTATWGQAGNSFFVASEHAETQATSITLTSPGLVATVCPVECVTKTTVPPVATTTGATISTTVVSNITCSGFAYVDGVAFSGGNGSSASTVTFNSWIINNSSVTLNSTSVASAIAVSNTNSAPNGVSWNNVTTKFGATGQNIVCGGSPFYWKNTASAVNAGGSIPTTLFTQVNARAVSVFLQAVDLSALGTGKTIVGTPGVNGGAVQTFLQDCKLGASVTVAATPTTYGQNTFVIRSDNSGTNYRHEKYAYPGTQTVETTITRTGGATDGGQLISWKAVSTANSKWILPFENYPISIWNTSTSAITTLTIYGTTTGGGVPNDDQIWIDVEYLSSGSFPQGSIITTTKASNLAASAAVNNSSDASTWGGGGAGNGFKIVCPSFTPGMAGPINITVKVAKATSTYYIDPKPSISGANVSKSEILAPGVYTNELSSSLAQSPMVIQRGTPF